MWQTWAAVDEAEWRESRSSGGGGGGGGWLVQGGAEGLVGGDGG